jgi:hypothetical protein
VAVGSGSAVAAAAGGGDLPAVSAAGVFDRGLERGRLAALRGGSEFGAVAARVEQAVHARGKTHIAAAAARELLVTTDATALVQFALVEFFE